MYKTIFLSVSAGVGRTGTFIALDCLMDDMAATSSIDVTSQVWAMRERRTEMVQTSVKLVTCIRRLYYYYSSLSFRRPSFALSLNLFVWSSSQCQPHTTNIHRNHFLSDNFHIKVRPLCSHGQKCLIRMIGFLKDQYVLLYKMLLEHHLLKETDDNVANLETGMRNDRYE